MFYNSKATNIDLSSFDTSSVTDMSQMFSSANVFSLDISNFDTSNVIDMGSMFSFSNILSLKLGPKFNTSKVTNMDNMFYLNRTTTTGYAKTQTDADKFNASSNKQSTLTFNIKSDREHNGAN